jgi:hypothetical protein
MPRPAHPGVNRATSPTSPDAKPSTKLKAVGPAILIVSGVTVPELASHWSVAASATIGAADVHRLPRPPRVGEAPPYLSPPSRNAAIYHQSHAAYHCSSRRPAHRYARQWDHRPAPEVRHAHGPVPVGRPVRVDSVGCCAAWYCAQLGHCRIQPIRPLSFLFFD